MLFLDPEDKNGITDTEFTINGREFKILNLPPMIAYEVFMESVRPCFKSIKDVDLTKGQQSLVEIFGSIDYVYIKDLTKVFMRHCITTKNDAGQWVKMSTDPDFFSQGMGPGHLAALNMRCFAVNFGSSCFDLIKEIGAAMGVDIIALLKENQTPSSSPESTQDITQSAT